MKLIDLGNYSKGLNKGIREKISSFLFTYKLFDRNGLMFIANNFLENKDRAENIVNEYLKHPVESEFYMTPAHFTQHCVNIIKEDIEKEKGEIIVQ